MTRPQGRPLAEHFWRDGGWYHAVTGKPFTEEVYIAGVRRRQAECERRLALTTSQSCYKKSSLVIGSGIGAFMRSTGIFAFRVALLTSLARSTAFGPGVARSTDSMPEKSHFLLGPVQLLDPKSKAFLNFFLKPFNHAVTPDNSRTD